MAKQSVATETILLAGICLLDTFWTILVVLAGIAIEANPLVAWSFDHGPIAFASVKVASLIPGLVALEYCRAVNPTFAIWAGRAGVVGYLGLYVVGSLKLHGLFG